MNKKLTLFILVLSVGIGFMNAGCSEEHGTSTFDGDGSIVAADLNLFIDRNSTDSVVIPTSPSATFELVTLPAHGSIQFSGNDIVYAVTDSTYTGTDNFTFRYVEDKAVSNVASVKISIVK